MRDPTSVHNMERSIAYVTILIAGAVAFEMVAAGEFQWDIYTTHVVRNRMTREAGRTGNLVCCRSSKPPIMQKTKDAMSACRSHVQHRDHNENTTQWQMNRRDRKRFVCFTQCTAEKMGMVDKEGYLVEESWLQTVEQNGNFSDSLKAVRRDAVKNCTSFANSYAKREKMETEEQRCNAAAVNAAICFKLQVEANCPEELKVTSEPCESYREKALADLKRVNATMS